jgi:hypothetical protein
MLWRKSHQNCDGNRLTLFQTNREIQSEFVNQIIGARNEAWPKLEPIQHCGENEMSSMKQPAIATIAVPA